MEPTLKKAMAMMLFGALLAACSTPPLFPAAEVKEVDPNIRFADLEADPTTFKGRVVQLAGRIVRLDQTAEGTLVVMHRLRVVEHPVYGPAEAATKGPMGEFTFLFPRKLDPAAIAVGDRLIVIGTVQGARAVPLDGGTQTEPYLLAHCLHVWDTKGEEIYDYTARHGGDFYPMIEATYCARKPKTG